MNMTKEEYVKTFEICGTKVDLGLDDYGQCYFIEWTNESGEVNSIGLGTYNFNYLEEIYSIFDDEYKRLWRKDFFGEKMTEEEEAAWKHYKRIFDEEYKNLD